MLYGDDIFSIFSINLVNKDTLLYFGVPVPDYSARQNRKFLAYLPTRLLPLVRARNPGTNSFLKLQRLDPIHLSCMFSQTSNI